MASQVSKRIVNNWMEQDKENAFTSDDEELDVQNIQQMMNDIFKNAKKHENESESPLHSVSASCS